MNPPPLPVPKRPFPLVLLLAILALFGIAALAALAWGGITWVQKAKQSQIAAQAAMRDVDRRVDEERAKMADALVSGEPAATGESLDRMRATLESSAGQFSPDDARAARSMAALLGKFQAEMQPYEAMVKKLTDAEVFVFKLRDRATLEKHRAMIREFLSLNERLVDLLQRSEEVAAAEMDAAGVPDKIRAETLQGFAASQARTRPLNLRVRATDRTLGEAALATFDLLEKEWGKWNYDEAAGQLRFDSDGTLAAFNTHIETIQRASAEQIAAQAELAQLMRASVR